MKLIFVSLSCVFGVVCLLLAYLAAVKSVREPEACRRLPREPRWAGVALGTLCLVWSAWHGAQMLEGDLEKFRVAAWALVPVTAVLSYFYLDYVNARSLGGFLTLCANHLVNAAFAFDVPGRGFYCVLCLVMGVAGMVGIGLPWRYRDWLKWSGTDRRVGIGSAVFLGVTGVAALVMPWFARM